MKPYDFESHFRSALGFPPPRMLSAAEMVMRGLNRNAFVKKEGDEIIVVEDWVDSPEQGNVYRLGYFSTPDARHAQAYCLENPFDPSKPNCGYEYADCHCYEDGNICLGYEKHRGELKQSAYTLEEAVRKARFWCTGFSHYRETGEFPQP